MNTLIDFRSLTIVFIVGAILLLIPQSQSLKCYVCDSPPSGPCGQDFNASHADVKMETCSADNSCYKAYTKVADAEKYARSCGPHAADTSKCEQTEGGTACGYVCNKDLCNESKSIHGSVVIAIILISAISMLIN